MVSGFPEVLSCSVLRSKKEYILQPKQEILNNISIQIAKSLSSQSSRFEVLPSVM